MDEATADIISLTKELVKFKTTKEQQDEIRKCMDFIKAYFSEKDFLVKEFEKNGRISLLISYKETKKPKLLLNGHIDVVEGDESQFIPLEKGKRLYGRGASDMKAGVAGFMVLMKEFAGRKPDMALMIVSDEEVGGFDCSGYLCGLGYSGDFIVASEPNQSKSPSQLCITTHEKGVLWVKVKAKGKSCHGSRPWLGENAVDNLLSAYKKINRLFPKTKAKDRWKTTVNLGKISGGNSPNRVPDEAEMVLDFRFPESTSSKEIIEKIKGIGNVEIEVIEEGALLANEDYFFIDRLKESVERITKKRCEYLKEHGASDLRYFSDKKVPCAIFGPFGQNYHGNDEYVDIKSIGLFYRSMKDFVEKNIQQ